MPTPDQVRATVSAYVDAIHTKDRESFVGLFSTDAVTQDPVPGELNEGPVAIGRWWDTMLAPLEKVAFEIRDVHVCGDQAAMVWSITATPQGMSAIIMKGVDLFTVTDDGKIRSMYAYWDPAEIVAA
jgi:steroid delta-isomerase